MWALLPVKSPSQSKTRLTSVLLDQECAALSWAMLQDMMSALDAAEEVGTIALLTQDEEVIDFGSQRGYQIITEVPGAGLNASIDTATTELAEAGVDRLLILPVDLPTIRSSEIDELCRGHRGGLSVCPAIRDGGTNALVATPPNAVAAQFGPDSARQFLKTARENGISATRVELRAFERDIDRPDDLDWLLQQRMTNQTSNYLTESGIADRLQNPTQGAIA
ncbi:MAG: 2-phospho-L-lactate guanylyltransferase [Gammaproteobacteria bacterium]